MIGGLHLRRRRHHRLQSRRRGAARALQAPRSRDARRESLGIAGEHQRLSGCARKAPTAPRSSTPNSSREQGAALGGVTVFTFDSDGHFQHRIEAKSATLRTRLLAARRRARLCQRQGAGHRGQLSARHQSDARASAGKLRHARNGAVLAIADLHRDGGPRRSDARPATGCNISSSWRVRSCSPPWCCSRLP